MRKKLMLAVAAMLAISGASAQNTVSIKTTDHDINISVKDLKSIEFNDDELTEILRIDTVVIDKNTLTPEGFVDLGLPSGTKWASRLFGSGSKKNRMYRWGEMQPDSTFLPAAKSPIQQFYCNPLNHNTQLIDKHNVVKQTLGEHYDYPTLEQAKELIDNVIIHSVADTLGTSGFVLTSKINGNQIFVEYLGAYNRSLEHNAALVPYIQLEYRDNESFVILTKDLDSRAYSYALSMGVMDRPNMYTTSKEIDTPYGILPVFNPEVTKVEENTDKMAGALDALNEFVDLGLPSGTKWSSQYLGYYDEWEQPQQTNYNNNVPKYAWGTTVPLKTADNQGYEVEKTSTIPAVNNVVYQTLGLGFDIPTVEQFNELINPEYTTIETTKYGNKVSYITITSKINGKKLRLYNHGIADMPYWSGRQPYHDNYTPIIWLKESDGKTNGIYGTFEAYAGFFLPTTNNTFYTPNTNAGPVGYPAWFGLPILPVYNGEFVDSYTGKKIPEEVTCGFEDSEGSVFYGTDLNNQVEKKFSELVDDPQYGGDLLYGDQASNYVFKDPRTGLITGLRTNMCKLLGIPVENSYGDAFYSGGAALANTWKQTWAGGGYQEQLSFYGPENNGTALMLYGYNDEEQTAVSYDSRPIIAFEEDTQILSMNAYFPTYLLHSLMEGDGFNTPATDDTTVYLVIEGFDENHKSTGVSKKIIFNKARKNNLLKEGSYNKLNFYRVIVNASGIPASRYYMFNYSVSDDQKGVNGLNMPAYIGIDDIKTKKYIYQK